MRLLVFAVTLAALSLCLSACAPQTVVPPAGQASTYFQEGERFFEQELYADAIASWEKVRDSYYSPELNVLAELKIAEAHFLAEQYIESAAASEAFLKNHPDHPKVPDVLFQLGLCYFRQMNAKDQDQSVTHQALAAFETMRQRYPKDHRTEEIKAYIDRCQNQLAAHEVEVGRYYLKVGQYQAAISRFEGVFKKYPDYYDRDEAYYLLGQAYMLAGDKNKASETFNTLFNQFPQSEFILASQKFIEKNY
jgi:outer membrane protein assembly factor BamD